MAGRGREADRQGRARSGGQAGDEAALRAYRAVVVASSQEVVAALRDAVGAGPVARLAGVSETRVVHDWAEGRRAVRSAVVDGRLRLAYQALLLLAHRHAPGVAARWFDTPCPALGYATPGNLLAGSTPQDAGIAFMAAARAATD